MDNFPLGDGNDKEQLVRSFLSNTRVLGAKLNTIFSPRHFIADRIASAKPWRKLNRWAHGNQQIKKLRPDAERSIDVGLGRVEIGRFHLTAWIGGPNATLTRTTPHAYWAGN